MSNTPHTLSEEFPEHVARIHDLRGTDAHFAKICDAYHTANRAVHAAETDVQPASDEHITALRKERMRLKDEIYSVLTHA